MLVVGTQTRDPIPARKREVLVERAGQNQGPKAAAQRRRCQEQQADPKPASMRRAPVVFGLHKNSSPRYPVSPLVDERFGAGTPPTGSCRTAGPGTVALPHEEPAPSCRVAGLPQPSVFARLPRSTPSRALPSSGPPGHPPPARARRGPREPAPLSARRPPRHLWAEEENLWA